MINDEYVQVRHYCAKHKHITKVLILPRGIAYCERCVANEINRKWRLPK